MSDATRLAIVGQAEGAEPQVLDRRRLSLVRRLDDGYQRIDQAVASGADVAAWETFWIDLLREYESVCDEMLAAA
jgi:hypothetical protein